MSQISLGTRNTSPSGPPKQPAENGRLLHPRAFAAACLALIVLGGTLAISIFLSLPSNVLSSRDGSTLRAVAAEVMPQGWSFFTKPPNDPEVVPYLVRSDGSLAYASQFPNAAPENLFGISRVQRAQGPEMAFLANHGTEWHTCTAGAEPDCRRLAADSPGDPVENTAPSPTLCGRVVLVETRPVPWAYRNEYSGWRLDSRATGLDVTC